MKRICARNLLRVLGMAALMIWSVAPPLHAHCDGMDGPVVKAARESLETGNVNLALSWVEKQDEAEIREAFRKTLALRKKGAEARELADLYFFETLVRVHRAGEGAPYRGLKPAGRDLGPAIPAADKAIADGQVDPLVRMITHEVEEGLRKRFREVVSTKDFDKNDAEAGRRYVKAYVAYIHYVERLHEAASKGILGHFPEHEEHEGK